RAEAQGQEPPKTSKRKRDGVVYTPGFVTRFIVEETIGKTLAERFAAMRHAHGVVETKSEKDVTYDWTPEAERAVWRDYRQELQSLTIVDPACGSGAFLIAAFDYLEGEYKRVAERLKALGDKTETGDVEREILAGNLHGVDLNPEPVEITKLSLWLKTAKRGKMLQDLDASIKCGNSLIADKNEHGRAFDWQVEFPQIFGCGGFDIVLGNPPYVRMETIKPFKPYLEKHYAVASDRADLYAYFYEKGFELLRPGGRLGYISSSTFLRTGSGEPLRHYLRTRGEIETIVDFGDLQIFEGVTTYPAIITMRRARSFNKKGQGGELRFLNIKSDVPKDLSRVFRAAGQLMPRARLGDGSWQLEGDKLAALRAKIKAGRKTLGEVYGAPLYGIKTGLNEAFIVSRDKRDELVARDPRSAELLVPFLRGENIKRWRVESEDLFLINIPKGKSLSRKLAPNRSPHPEEPRSGVSEGERKEARGSIASGAVREANAMEAGDWRGVPPALGRAPFETQASWAPHPSRRRFAPPQDEDEAFETGDKINIDDYPAIRDHLLPFKAKLEARATKQEWFELQQAQLAYQSAMQKPKIIWPQILDQPEFCFDRNEYYPINKAYFFPTEDVALAAYLNSRTIWFCFISDSVPKSGGYREATAQHICPLPSADRSSRHWHELRALGGLSTQLAENRYETQKALLRRIPDLCPHDRKPKLTTRLEEWWKLDFKSFQAEIKKAFKADIPLKQRNEWEAFLREEGEKVRRLTVEIEQAEREIDAIVYQLFDLTPDETSLLESSLAGQY
ncbi:MAG: Eco57I restriction-modification methylase domain-containing protein, partial [Methylocella sp.]